jgi:hypothetical protein
MRQNRTWYPAYFPAAPDRARMLAGDTPGRWTPG